MSDVSILKQEELNNKLRHAMYNHNYDYTRLLIDEGADPNTTNMWGTPYIYWCSEKGRLDLIEFALENGADIHATNKIGETALHRAAWVGKIDVIDYLLDRGADINQKSAHHATPLFLAAFRDQPLSVEKLLSRGADPSIKNRDGVSAAETAIEKGHDTIVAMLATV
jgi:ankyrin repeat protein